MGERYCYAGATNAVSHLASTMALLRAWHHLHAIPQNHPKRGSRGPRPLLRRTLILVEVERLPKRTRLPKQMWLWWHGPERAFPVPPLACLRRPLPTGTHVSLFQTVPQLDSAADALS